MHGEPHQFREQHHRWDSVILGWTHPHDVRLTGRIDAGVDLIGDSVRAGGLASGLGRGRARPGTKVAKVDLGSAAQRAANETRSAAVSSPWQGELRNTEGREEVSEWLSASLE